MKSGATIKDELERMPETGEHDPWLLEALKNTSMPDAPMITESVLPQAPAVLSRLKERHIMQTPIDAVIIGAGHAGLSTSYCLTQTGHSHVVLEQGRIGESWRSKRWDSLTLVIPNWACRLPGYPYDGNDPDGFMGREEVVDYLESYARSFQAPVREGVRVSAVTLLPNGRYLVSTDDTIYETPTVVIASGFFEHPKIPVAATGLSADIVQIHSSQYRNPGGLPPGAVLVVGSAASGCQIAEELHEAGRRVYLATGKTRRVPRRYRGKDTAWWLEKIGLTDLTVDHAAPNARYDGSFQISGKRGGHPLNLHQFARDGIVLLGRFKDAKGDRVEFAADLKENLAAADAGYEGIVRMIEGYIEKMGINVPQRDESDGDEYAGKDGYAQAEILELDLRREGIGTVVWAAGFRFDYSFVHLPVFDEAGYPMQQRGITRYPGLYFMGVHYQHTLSSDWFLGVGRDAKHVAGTITREMACSS